MGSCQKKKKKRHMYGRMGFFVLGTYQFLFPLELFLGPKKDLY